MKKKSYKQEALNLHKNLKGKLDIRSKKNVTKKNLSLLYTPGVAVPCLEIAKKPNLSYDLTNRGNLIAVISDGTAVLGLGDIGPFGAMPVMEGKCILFKQFGGIDAFPLCIDSKDVKTLVSVIKNLEPSFGGINLEDISAPRCFEIENILKKELCIPVFHDDQHGTAVVVLAGLINAMKIADFNKKNVRVVINGAGAAGIAVCKFLLSYGFKNIVVSDHKGIISGKSSNSSKRKLAKLTNPEKITGNLKHAIKGAEIFIGLSVANVLLPEMVKTMKKNPIIFALANPIPEILPELAIKCGVKLIATGRSDYPNQVNNVIAFPGIMRGALAVRAKDINNEMKLAASLAISSLIPDSKLSPKNFIPKANDLNIAPKVAASVAKAALKTKIAGIKRNIKDVEKETITLIKKSRN